MARSDTTAIDILKARLVERFGRRLARLIIFGSWARGEAAKDSDIDVLVALEGPVDWQIEDEVLSLCYDVELACDVVFDVKVFSADELRTGPVAHTPFIESVLAQGVTVV